MELLDDMSGFDEFDTQVSPWFHDPPMESFEDLDLWPVAILCQCWTMEPLWIAGLWFQFQLGCWSPLTTTYCSTFTALKFVLCPKLFRDDCRKPHFRSPLQYFLAFHYVGMFYNLRSLGLPTQKRVWWPSAGIRLSGNVGFRHCSAQFLHKPLNKA